MTRTIRRRRPLALERLEDRTVPVIGFGKSILAGVTLTNPTSLQFGPDGKLYVAEQGGLIDVYTVARTGANAYAATAAQSISLVKTIPNHNDDGTLNPAVTGRQVTGLLVTGSAANPVLYATSSDPRIGGGSSGTNTGLDTNSGILSRLDWTGSTWVKTDLVRGLPRSQENHSSNGMALDPATNTLYIGQAGHTNMGAPSNNFAFLPEFALSAAVLSVNISAIGNATYDLPTLVAGGTSPFGGSMGNNQAILVPGGPVQVYMPGFRNPYDLVLTRAGRLYTIDNGSNAGWGDVPVDPAGAPTTAATAGSATNKVHEPGVSDPDALHLVTPGGYAGHPNPTRANRANTFNPANPQSPVATANPVEGYHPPVGAANGSLTTFGTSTNGLTEYMSANFGGEMTGNLLAASFDNTIYRIVLSADGTSVVSNTPLFANVGQIPLDVTTVTAGALAGTVWVADYMANSVVVFEPNDLGGGVAGTGEDDPTLDEDKDGFTNRDELASGTAPLSAADVPHDWDGDFVSDKLDTDDDNDGVPDAKDPFAIDPANGRNTPLPVAYPWDNATPYPGGLLNLGFTGLMTNGATDYATLYDTTKMTAGGAAGAMTIDQVTAGTAKGAANTQAYGFQFGVNATPTSPPFVLHTRLKGAFAGLTPQTGQQIGLQFGTGDQDNYIELAVDGGGSVQLMKEVGGSWSLVASTPLTLAGGPDVDLYLSVNPSGSVQAFFTTTVNGVTSAKQAVGPVTNFPAGWLTAATAPAVGVMTTTGGGPTFPATYDLMEVGYGWAAGADLPTPLGEVAGGVIDGKLYLVGDGSTGTLAYDLATKTWTTGLAARPFIGDHHTAEVLNGKLYLFGGLGGGSEGKMQIYDPVANTWSVGPSMPFAAGASSSAVINGRVYVAGGIVGTGTTNQAAMFNPATGNWSLIPVMPQARNHAAATTDGSKLYLFGGRGPGSGDGNVVANGFNTVQIYDPATNSWVSSLDPGSPIQALPQARGGTGKAVFYNGEFYVMGGETLTGAGATPAGVYDRVDVYNPVAKTWRLGVPMSVARHGIFPLLATTAQGGTNIYVAGGGVAAGNSQSAVLDAYLLTSPAAPSPTLPAAPTGLTAQGALPTRVVLAWQDAATNETGYQIERKTGTGTYAVIATVAAGVISYTDVTALGGTAYTYRAAAKNTAGLSAYTNEATVTPPALSNTPYGVSPWAVGATIEAETFDYGGQGVGYSDTSPANEGGAYRNTGVDIEATTDVGGGFNVGYAKPGEWVGYTVSVGPAGTFTLELRVAASGAGGKFHVEVAGVDKTGSLAIPDTGGWQTWRTLSVPVQLSAGVQVVRVVWDAVGTSGYAGNLNWLKLTAAATAPGVPAAPSGLTATDSPTQVNLTWTDNSSNETGFVIERAANGGAFQVIATVGPGVTAYADASAWASTSYTYRVGATGSAGNSASSNLATVTTAAAVVTITDVSKTAGKGTTAFDFVVALSRPSSVPVTLQYQTSDGTALAGTDYTAAGGTLTFAPGEKAKTISVQVARNRKQTTRVFYVDLSGLVNGTFLKSRATGTILT